MPRCPLTLPIPPVLPQRGESGNFVTPSFYNSLTCGLARHEQRLISSGWLMNIPSVQRNIMQKRFFNGMMITVFLLIPIGEIYAQSTLDTGSLRGRITNNSGEAIPGAIIRMKGENGAKASESDSNGNFSIGFVTPGSYAVTISADGYQEQSQEEFMFQVEKATHIRVVLQLTGSVESNDVSINWHVSTSDVKSTINMAVSINLAEAINEFASYWDAHHAPLPNFCCFCADYGGPANIPVIVDGHIHVSKRAMDTFGWRSLKDIY